MKSYSLSKHVRWIVIILKLLQCWLKKKHLQLYYHFIIQIQVKANTDDFITIKIIIWIFELIVKSTSFLMTDKLEEKAQFLNIIKKVRLNFQQLLDVVINAASMNSRSRSATSVQWNSQFNEVAIELIEDDLRSTSKIMKYINDKKRSNVHTMLHYETTMIKYDMLSNINILVEENKHK